MGRKFPFLKVTVAGRPVSDQFYSRIIEMTLTDVEGAKSDKVSIKLRDKDPTKPDGDWLPIPNKGDVIEVYLGYRDGVRVKKGSYKVEETGIEMFPHVLNVEGKALPAHHKMFERRNKHYDNMTVKDIVEDIAKRHSLSVKIDASVASHKYEWQGLIDQSDADYLQRLSKRHSALFDVKDNCLIWADKNAGKGTSGNPLPHLIITPDLIIPGTPKVKLGERGRFKKVRTRWFDKEIGKIREYLEKADEDGDNIDTLPQQFADEAEAKQAAKSRADAIKAGFDSTSLSTIGLPEAMAGATFEYMGCRPQVDGVNWVISKLVDKINKKGWRTQISGKIKAKGGNKTASGRGKKKSSLSRNYKSLQDEIDEINTHLKGK